MVTAADLVARLRHQRILAILRGRDRDATVAAGLALIDSGIGCLEVSLSGADALGALGDLAAAAPDGALLGAGTVVTVDDVRHAHNAGARFVVTPGRVDSVEEACRRGMPVIGGALTPSEVIVARAHCAAVKLFPASALGPAYLQALRAPFPDVDFVAVGGMDEAAARGFLGAGALAVGVGSPLVGDAADGGNLDELRARARVYLQVASEN